MSLESLFELEGEWAGTYKLWFSPTDPHLESKTSAGIKPGIRGTCVKVAYDWEYEEKTQEGLIVCAFNPNRELVRAAWFDSFHMANDFLGLRGIRKGRQDQLRRVIRGTRWTVVAMAYDTRRRRRDIQDDDVQHPSRRNGRHRRRGSLRESRMTGISFLPG